MEQIGGNNTVFRIACLLFLEFFFFFFFFFSYSLIVPCFSMYLNSRRGFFFYNVIRINNCIADKTVIFNFTKSNPSFRFRFDRRSDLSDFSEFRNYEAYCIVGFSFFYIYLKIYASSISRNRSSLRPREEKKIMIDRCFFIPMEANDRYKLIAWWGSNDIMIKREKKNGMGVCDFQIPRCYRK